MPPKGEKRKQQIIDTAKEMFISKGFQSTHIGQVCEHLDIARGTVYQYFSNKKEILYAILDNVSEDMEDILDPDDLKDYLKTKPDTEVLVRWIDNRISTCLELLSNEPIVIKLMYRDIVGIDEEVSEKVKIFTDHIVETISREIGILRDNGIFKKELDPLITASMLVGGIMMVVYQYMKQKKNFLDKNVTKSMAILYMHGVYDFS
ncbi:MAG: TetR/AcrR family transcriptional regulator [Spirochaetes bacterium]|nr:TetR/AcrR family transcriptional regulator [Spirochaetota bacterium]